MAWVAVTFTVTMAASTDFSLGIWRPVIIGQEIKALPRPDEVGFLKLT
jgi:hypothetical protein